MNYVKFSGLIKEIQDLYTPDFDIKEFVKNKLNIDDTKAELIVDRIINLFDFKTDYILRNEKPIKNETDTNCKNNNNHFNIYSLD